MRRDILILLAQWTHTTTNIVRRKTSFVTALTATAVDTIRDAAAVAVAPLVTFVRDLCVPTAAVNAWAVTVFLAADGVSYAKKQN